MLLQLILALALADVTTGGPPRPWPKPPEEWRCTLAREVWSTTECVGPVSSNRGAIIRVAAFYNFGRRAHIFQIVTSPVSGNHCATNPEVLYESPPVEHVFFWRPFEAPEAPKGIPLNVPAGQPVCCRMSDILPSDIYTGFSCSIEGDVLAHKPLKHQG